jgi:Ca-activated chloride channel family protein
MTTDRKRMAAIHVAAPAAMTVLLCLGCGSENDQQPQLTSFKISETEPAADIDGEAMTKMPVAEFAEQGDVALLKDSETRPILDEFNSSQPGADRDDSVTGGKFEMDSPAVRQADGPLPVSSRLSPVRRGELGGRRIQGLEEQLVFTARHATPTPRATFELQPGEELWVIAASESGEKSETHTAPDPAILGCGALLAQFPENPKRIPIPLKHTDVRVTIDGYIASVAVRQQFENPFDSKIEAVYVFPLPQNAAVNDFVMTVGDRRIRGIIRERQEAEKIYKQAKSQGHVASLMTQERPNIFTQKVANIEPGKQIDIDIRYFHTLQWDDGDYEFVFPMVVGPRFNPSGSADPIAAVARGSNAAGGHTSVEYLAPHERSGHDISLTVDVRAGVDIERIESVNHPIETEQLASGRRQVSLTTRDSILNRDFVLRYRVAGNTVKSALMTHRDEHGQYFTMMLYPPAELSSLQRSPMEMVFVLDCSGSMSGPPLDQSKAAVRQALTTLTPRDTFQIIRFSSHTSQLGKKPLPATGENVQRALSWLSTLSGSGGTEMIEGIKAALDFPHDEGHFRLVSFLTDGYIGNEQQILTTLNQKCGASRVFSFGVGQSPNRYLMDRMAGVGRGAVTYLSLNDDATDVMNRFAERISHPALTDVAIDWGDMQVEDVYPSRLPDLIVGRPIIRTGRFTGVPSKVRVGGQACMKPVDFEVAVVDDQQEHKGIAAVWARHKIADLTTQAARSPGMVEQIKRAVLQTALNHNLMSTYTAFIAVDSLTQTDGEFGTTVAVPVPVPEGVRYETAVSK